MLCSLLIKRKKSQNNPITFPVGSADFSAFLTGLFCVISGLLWLLFISEVAESQRILEKAEQQVVDLRLLLRTLREMTDVKELTPTLVNSLIERIEVHNNDKSSGHCYVKVDIYFTAAGMIDIPTEEEILAMMAEIRENPQEFRFVA